MVDEQTDRMRRAAATARASEHHWPADMLMEAAETIDRLREELDAAQLRSIEARNPGIDMERVKRERREVTEGQSWKMKYRL